VVALLLAMFVAPAAAQYGQTIHIVERGETLASIARIYGVTVQAIAQANNIWNPNLVYAGARLYIPFGGNPGPFPPPQQSSYIVRYGDTLASIATQYGTTPDALKQYNPGLTDSIYVNQVIFLPPVGGGPLPDTGRNANP